MIDKIKPHKVIVVLRDKNNLKEHIKIVSPYGVGNLVWVEVYEPLTPLEEKVNEIINYINSYKE